MRETVGISTTRRGVSLDVTLAAPEPEVLPPLPSDNNEESPSEEVSTGDCVVSENLGFETEVVALVNAARFSAGLSKLSEHALLTQVAREHSVEMACGGFFDHDSPISGPVDERVEVAGYQFYAIGENIAMGYGSPEAVVDAWLASEGHRENLFGLEFTQIGIGFALVEAEAQTRYWTILFASPENP